MRKALLAISAMGLLAASGSAVASDAAALSEACLDCHEFAYDFEGVGADEMYELLTGVGQNPKHKASQGLTDEDLKALADYIAAEAAK